MRQTLVFLTACFIATLVHAQPVAMGDNTTAEDYAKILQAADRASRDLSDLPASYSLKKYTPTPMSQGQFGTCVAWSSGYAARTISYAIKMNMTDKESINKYAFSPGYLYYKIKDPGDDKCSKGANVIQAMNTMTKSGIMLKNDGIVDCSGTVSETVERERALPYKIKDFLSLCPTYDNISKNDILKIKKSLTENKPVVLSFKVYHSFMSMPETGLWTPVENDAYEGGHGMCIVGYDDDKAGGAFEVMNSWGTRWGNGGFVWITYQQIMKYGKYAVEMMEEEPVQPVKPVKPPAQPVKPPTPPVQPVQPPVQPVKPPVQPPVQPVAKPQLSGNMEFIKLDESAMPVTRKKINTRSFDVEDDDKADYSLYKFKESYSGGLMFKVKFTSNAPCYIYIFGEDDKAVISRLFPYNSTISAAINSSNATYYLPSEKKHAKLSSGYGKENFCVLYSKSQIDFEGLMDYIKTSKTTIYQGVMDKLGDRLLNLKKVEFEDEKISFKAAAEDKSVLCFFIELEHQ